MGQTSQTDLHAEHEPDPFIKWPEYDPNPFSSTYNLFINGLMMSGSRVMSDFATPTPMAHSLDNPIVFLLP